MIRATAAKGTFPYPHRTLAEIDEIERVRLERLRHRGVELCQPVVADLSPVSREWCWQCERRVTAVQEMACGSKFCALRGARKVAA
jgi:hypothetical protein